MALVPQTVDVPFEGGLDTHTDRKKVIPGKLLELQNAVFDGSSIEIRPGSSYVADGVVTGGSLTEARAVDVVGDELLRWTTGGVYGRAAATASPWVLRADATDAKPLTYTVDPIAQRPRSCENFDMATLFGVTVYIWTEGQESGVLSARRVLRATVVDDVTRVRYLDAVELANDANSTDGWRIQCRVIASGGAIHVFYGIGGTLSSCPLYVRQLQPGNPTSFSGAVQVATMKVRVGPSFPYEFAVVDMTPTASPTAFTTGNVLIAYGAVAGGLTLAWFALPPGSPPTAFSSPAPVTQTPTTGGTADAYKTVHLEKTADKSRAFLLFCNFTTSKAELHTFRTLDMLALAHTDLGVSLGGYRLTSLETSTGVLTAYIEPEGSSPLLRAVWNSAGTVTTTAGAWARGLRLAGAAFTFSGRRFLPCLYQDVYSSVSLDVAGVQPTFFLLDADTGRVVARALTGECGGPLGVTVALPHSTVTADFVALLVPRRQRVEFQADSGVAFDVSSVGLARIEVKAGDPCELLRVEENGTLHMGGAAPSYYDGSTWVEDGFHVSPEGVKAAGSGAGSLSAGTYSWVVCYEWVDAKGRMHRSAPSIPVGFVATAGGRAQLTIPLLHLTRKVGVRLAIYRTTANGTVFYRLSTSVNNYIQPDPGTAVSDTVSRFDGAADSSIIDNEILSYSGPQGGSVGGELWHRPPPAYRVAHRHGDYLFHDMMDDSFQVAYSLPLADGEGPAWPVELRMRMPSKHGPVRALATMDDKLVILTSGGAYVVLGQGPNRAGTDNGYSEPVFVTGSVGCVSAASVVNTPDGLMWQSASGLYLLSRGLEVVKLGSGVDAYAGQTVARALEVPSRGEVRWYTREGTTMVYSTEWRQWSTWTSQPTRDAVLKDGVVHYADGTRIRYEDATSRTEGGATFPMVIGSAWLKWAGMQGLQRVWKAILLGTVGVTVRLKSEVFYDYDDTAPGHTAERVFPGSSVGGPPVFQVRQTLGKQLAKALRFRWTLTPEPSAPGDSGELGLTSLTLEFGAHRAPGKRRTPSL